MIRKNLPIIFLVLVFSPLLSTKSLKAEEKKHWTDVVKIEAEIRTRSETNLNYNNIPGDSLATASFAYPETTGLASFVLLRTRLGLNILPHEHVGLYVQLQDSRTFGLVGLTENNSGGNGVSGSFGVHQAYLDLLDIGNSGISLRVGRQELKYGKERLVGAFGWHNVARSFDAVRLKFEWKERLSSDWFASLVTRGPGADNYFVGTYNTLKALPTGDLDAYFLVDLDGDAVGGAKRRIYTGGLRSYKKFKLGLDYDVEAAIQFGDIGASDLLAGAGHASLGYTFDHAYKPRLGVEYNFASGDGNAADGKAHTFYNLYPTNHDKYGIMDFFCWRNLHDISANISIAPIDKTNLSLAYHAFLLPKPVDGFYRAGMAFNTTGLRSGNAGASSFAGHEVDLLFTWKPIEYFDLLAGYSVFIPGQFFQDTAASTNDIAHFLYLQLTGHYQ